MGRTMRLSTPERVKLFFKKQKTIKYTSFYNIFAWNIFFLQFEAGDVDL